jgi:predicted methyltransferase
MQLVVLSHYQAQPLLAAHAAHLSTVRISIDLNLTQVDVTLEDASITLPDGQRLAWAHIESIAQNENGCFHIHDGTATKIQAYSDETDRYYSLYPTQLAPTMLLSGLPMHRIKDTDPHHDTLAKVKAASLTRGRALDTCTGLGYTAIEAAKVAEHVTTIELDPAAQTVARLNPWSQALFDNPRITRVMGDVAEEIERFDDASFSRVIHDPPMFALGGDLYSSTFYTQMHRVLEPGGRVFHYIGDLESASGSRVARGAVERLKRAGFHRVTPRPEAFGLVATKS